MNNGIVKIRRIIEKAKTDGSVSQKPAYGFRNVPSEAKLRKFIRHVIFRENLFCPYCLSRFVKVIESRYHCRACRSKFSVLSFTGLSHLRVSFRQLWLVFWCWSHGMNHDQSAIICRLSKKSIRRWFAFCYDHIPKSKSIHERILQLDESLFKGWAPVAKETEGKRLKTFRLMVAVTAGRHYVKKWL